MVPTALLVGKMAPKVLKFCFVPRLSFGQELDRILDCQFLKHTPPLVCKSPQWGGGVLVNSRQHICQTEHELSFS